MSARRTFAGGFNSQSEAMRHYPALLCLWVMGASAILAEQENLLARLLLEPTWIPTTGATKPQPAVRCLNPSGSSLRTRPLKAVQDGYTHRAITFGLPAGTQSKTSSQTMTSIKQPVTGWSIWHRW